MLFIAGFDIVEALGSLSHKDWLIGITLGVAGNAVYGIITKGITPLGRLRRLAVGVFRSIVLLVRRMIGGWRRKNDNTVRVWSEMLPRIKAYGTAGEHPYKARLIVQNCASQVMAVTGGDPNEVIGGVYEDGSGAVWTPLRIAKTLIERDAVPQSVCNNFVHRFADHDGVFFMPRSRTDPVVFEATWLLALCLNAQQEIPHGGKDVPS